MQRWIERLPDGIDYLEPGVAERFEQLLFHHVYALYNRPGVGRRGVDVREPRHVIERFDQLSNEIGLRAGTSILTLFRGALSIIVVLGRKSKVFVALIRQIRFPPARAGRGGFGRTGRCARVGRRIGRFAERWIAALAVTLARGSSRRLVVGRAHRLPWR